MVMYQTECYCGSICSTKRAYYQIHPIQSQRPRDGFESKKW